MLGKSITIQKVNKAKKMPEKNGQFHKTLKHTEHNGYASFYIFFNFYN